MEERKNADNTHAQMRKGLLEFCIILIIARGNVYAPEILEALRQADMIVVEGTLYPLLSRLKRAGVLDYEWVESSSGPPRKYYRLTKDGTISLTEALTSWTSLNASIQSLIATYEKNR